MRPAECLRDLQRLQRRGLQQRAVRALRRQLPVLPAVDLHVVYRRPLRLDEWVRGELRVQRRSARSITWRTC